MIHINVKPYLANIDEAITIAEKATQKLKALKSRMENNKFENSIPNILSAYATLDKCRMALLAVSNQHQHLYNRTTDYNMAGFNKMLLPKIDVEKLDNGYKIRIHEKAPLKHKSGISDTYALWQYYVRSAINTIESKHPLITMYDKTIVTIAIGHPLIKYQDYFDVDNIAISPIINTLKGVFFKDDSRDILPTIVIKNSITEDIYLEILITEYGTPFDIYQ